MGEPRPVDAFHELSARGLISADTEPQPLPGGNADRRDYSSRSSWLVKLPDGRAARLILGPHLADLARRQSAFSTVCPGLVPVPLFHQTLVRTEAFAYEFFKGETLESISGDSPALAQAGLTCVCATLATAVKTSHESARLAEWQVWTARVNALGLWTPEERQLLTAAVWPRLYPLLTRSSPAVRWTNGDFTSTNILLDDSGNPRLIDCEFAGPTHFYQEDAVRFHVLSLTARKSPGLFAPILPPPGPAWHLFFWLRQLMLESEQNTPDYFARVRPVRLAVIRRLAEQLSSCTLPGWSVDAADLRYTLEEARWALPARDMLVASGWCYLPTLGPLRAVFATHHDQVLAQSVPAGRPDVWAHFESAPNASESGFSLTIPLPAEDTAIVLSALTADGTLLPFHSFCAGDLPGRGPWIDDYPRWAALYDRDPIGPSDPIIPGPLFSILLPVYNTPPAFLTACIESVLHQQYPRWELCLVDDCSTSSEIAPVLQKFSGIDRRFKMQRRTVNGGIASATNDALASATGEFVVLLDHDDLLRPHALTELSRRLVREPGLDALYSDEDKITAEGRRLQPFLKPDFSPEFLLGVMYVGHVLCVRTTVARAAGGFNPAYDGVQDYEFFLRVTERTRRIGHVPRILYHWRQSPGSSALHGNVKGDMDARQAQAVQTHLQRLNRTEKVQPCGGHRVRLCPTQPVHAEIIRPNHEDGILETLRRVASASTAEVLVLLAAEALPNGGKWENDLANLALRPDSALIAPLVISREGRVLESGRTAGRTPLMRGLDPSGDGYHGSLVCTREVAAISPLCFAIRRELALVSLAGAAPTEDWWEYCERLRTGGLFHRVCPAVRIQVPVSWRDPTVMPFIGNKPDPFFNPSFDLWRADYALARPPAHCPPVLWHLETSLPADLPHGCLDLRGWCFDSSGEQLANLRLSAGSLIFFGVVGLFRPDVSRTFPEARADHAGFHIRGLLPAGQTTLTLEAGLADGRWVPLLSRIVTVKRRLLPVWLRQATWMESMFAQMPAHMAYPPKPIEKENFPPLRLNGSEPKISIVTPSYQQARFLAETMRSVLDQAGVDCGYVVQDGGSMDGSKELIARFAIAQKSAALPAAAMSKRPRLLAWASEADAGQADAIVRGFAKTSGGPDDLMAWINSDDFYLPGTLAYVADYFARHPDVDVLYGHRIVVNEESQEIARWFLPKHDAEVLRLNDFVPQETMFWRRRIWDKVGGLDASFRFAMDWDLLLRFQAAGARIVRVPYFLACFRVHAAQKTSAVMHSIGQKEINLLRERTYGRPFPPEELEQNPRLLRYLRRSAFIEFLWQRGLRSP